MQTVRALPCVLLLLVLVGGASAAERIRYFDDGTCAPGQIKQVTGGRRVNGTPRHEQCIDRTQAVGLQASQAAPPTAPAATAHRISDAKPSPGPGLAPGGRIDFVILGGNDCPPCVAWVATELPKLRALPEFRYVRYTHVTKAVKSPVPPVMFFPDEIKDLQPALMLASSGLTGSPQQAILVDGKVVDYWWGTEKSSPAELAAVFRALHDGTALPRKGCTKLVSATSCAER